MEIDSLEKNIFCSALQMKVAELTPSEAKIKLSATIKDHSIVELCLREMAYIDELVEQSNEFREGFQALANTDSRLRRISHTIGFLKRNNKPNIAALYKIRESYNYYLYNAQSERMAMIRFRVG